MAGLWRGGALENMESLQLKPEDAALVLGALDSMAVALTDHGHDWTEGERTIYEQAVAMVSGETWHERESA